MTPLLSPEEVSRITSLSVATLATWRIAYRPEDVELGEVYRLVPG